MGEIIDRIIRYLCYHGYFNWMSDKQYLSIRYYATFHKQLNLDNPVTYNEKLQWIKLYDHNPIYTTLVDKIKVREFIKTKIGEKYLIPIVGIWNSPDDIDFESLPNSFVLKCNHNSGKGMCICTNKAALDKEKTLRDLRNGFREKYYYSGREWPYKNVKPMILAEKYMVDESGIELKDYKVMCFNGEPKLIELHSGRFTNKHTQVFYDTNWRKTSITQVGDYEHFCTTCEFDKPDTLEEMLKLSAILSEGIPHVRVDWYSIQGRLFFGELTFFDGSGFEPFDNPQDDELLGSWISLNTLCKA